MNIFQKLIQKIRGKKDILPPVKVISIEEVSRGKPYNPGEMNLIRFIANAASVYQTTIHVLFETGIDANRVERIRNDSDVFFPDPQQKAVALNFLETLVRYKKSADVKFENDLNELTTAYIESGRSQEDVDTLRHRLKHDFMFFIGLLRDDAREDYYSAAQITKTLIHPDIWQEVVLPKLAKSGIEDTIPRLF